MKKFLSVISAFALLTGINTSCQKDIDPLQESNQITEFTITATIADNTTKVSYEEDGTTHALKPTWQVNDIIIGFDGATSTNTYGFKVTAVNDGKATLAIITEGNYAGSKTANPDNGTKMYMFYAPGKKPSDISSKSLTVSLASQSKDTIPALMMASATVSGSSLSLAFTNKTAIIAIKNPTMAAASTSYTSITLTGAGINTEVKFSLDGSNNLQAAYQTAGTITKAVEITSDGSKAVSGVTYIVACPTSSSTDLTFVTNYLETSKKTSKTIEVGKYYYMTPTFAGGHTEGLLPGVFSISTTKVAGFSKGNMYCNTTTSPVTYSFEDNQYSFASSWNTSHVSHFFWSKDSTVAYASSYSDGSAAGSDVFFTNDPLDETKPKSTFKVDGQTGVWRTLTNAELQYLVGSNATRTGLYAYGVTVAGKANCVVLYPDGYNGTKVTNGDTTSYDTEAEWSAAEAQGVVCLPAAGYRSSSNVSNVGDGGYYWSSTAYQQNAAYYLYLGSSEVSTGTSFARACGFSVRLVSAAQ